MYLHNMIFRSYCISFAFADLKNAACLHLRGVRRHDESRSERLPNVSMKKKGGIHSRYMSSTFSFSLQNLDPSENYKKQTCDDCGAGARESPLEKPDFPSVWVLRWCISVLQQNASETWLISMEDMSDWLLWRTWLMYVCGSLMHTCGAAIYTGTGIICIRDLASMWGVTYLYINNSRPTFL